MCVRETVKCMQNNVWLVPKRASARTHTPYIPRWEKDTKWNASNSPREYIEATMRERRKQLPSNYKNLLVSYLQSNNCILGSTVINQVRMRNIYIDTNYICDRKYTRFTYCSTSSRTRIHANFKFKFRWFFLRRGIQMCAWIRNFQSYYCGKKTWILSNLISFHWIVLHIANRL